jgi:hypothetical protein
MKKTILVILFGLILSVSPSYAVGGNLLQIREDGLAARSVKIASRDAKITQIQVKIAQDLKNRAQKEISRRVNYLTELITQLNGIKKLTSTQKTDLQSQIQTQIDGLNALQTKINGDTDNTVLKTDVKSIVNDYYIFLFFREKVNLLVAADKISATAVTLSQISTKLQARIGVAQANGEDVTTLKTMLTDMNAKIADANVQVANAQTELAPLTAAGYPGNKATLSDARTKLKAASQDLKTAYHDVLQLRDGLKEPKIKNPEASESAH